MIGLQLSPDGATVVNTIVLADDADPALFGAVASPHDDIAIGWVLDGGVWSPPANPVTLDDLRAYAARTRWAVEQGGIVVTGISVATDDRSKALIDGTVGYLADGGASPITFKAATGWVDLDEPAVRAIKQAIGAHIQACFAAEAAVQAAIDAGTVTTAAEIDAWEWPANG